MSISITAKQIQLGDIISCTVVGAGVVPNVVNEKCVGIVSGDAVTNAVAANAGHVNLAAAFEGENATLYGDITVPQGFRKYSYFQFMNTETGVIREVGLPWIAFGSVTRATRKALQAVFTDFDLTRLNELKELLRVRGFGDVLLTQLEVEGE